jgi:hypothetical protein
MSAGRRIFLAHAREDKGQVRELYADLKARGLDPWRDEVDLMPGQIWKEETPKAIRQAGVQIPTQAGHLFRGDVGHRSDVIPASVPR